MSLFLIYFDLLNVNVSVCPCLSVCILYELHRAEECFKRAIMTGQADPETFSRYADFLWVVRKDLWSAEEFYQQAIEAAPDSHYYASKYAHFLWSTGGEDTCFLSS